MNWTNFPPLAGTGALHEKVGSIGALAPAATERASELVYDLWIDDSHIGSEGDKHADSAFFLRFDEVIQTVNIRQDRDLAAKLQRLRAFFVELTQISWPGQTSTKVAQHFAQTYSMRNIQNQIQARVDSEVLGATRGAANAMTKLGEPHAPLFHAAVAALEEFLLPRCSGPDIPPAVQAVMELFYLASCEGWLKRIAPELRPEVSALLGIISDIASRSGDIIFADGMRELSVIARHG